MTTEPARPFELEPYVGAGPISQARRDEWAYENVRDFGEAEWRYMATTTGDSLVLVWDNGDGTCEVYDCLIRRYADAVPHTAPIVSGAP